MNIGVKFSEVLDTALSGKTAVPALNEPVVVKNAAGKRIGICFGDGSTQLKNLEVIKNFVPILIETLEFTPETWSATINVEVPTGIKSHKVIITISLSDPVDTAALTLSDMTDGAFVNFSIYNNDTVDKTINLPTGDMAGDGVDLPIVIEGGSGFDISVKNDGVNNIWQAVKIKEI